MMKKLLTLAALALALMACDNDLTGIFWERLGDNWARYRYWPWKLWSWMTRRDVEHILDLRGASSFAVQSCGLVHSVLPYTWLCRGRNEV